MEILIFTAIYDDLTGGNYRVLNVLKYFPKNEYTLAMPKNKKEKFLAKMEKYLSNVKQYYKYMENAIIMKDLNCKTPLCYIKYGYYVGEFSKKLGVDMLYFPHEHAYLPYGFRLSRTRWTELLQSTPVVGALSMEEGYGFNLFMKNLKANFDYNFYKIIRGYLRFKIFALAIRDIPILAVSKSIPYELEKLGVEADIRVVDPGVGVEPCPYVNSEKNYDLIFFARVVPEKGIFDYLRVVSMLVKSDRRIRALVVGFASDAMANRVREEVVSLGISRNVELRFNLPRNEALKLVSESKVMVYPTRLDAFPLSVLEALSCGTPVIAYSVPAIRFNYAETGAVIKVQPLNVDELVMRTAEVLNEGSWKELGREGVRFSEKYTWENVAKSEWSLLKSMVDNY